MTLVIVVWHACCGIYSLLKSKPVTGYERDVVGWISRRVLS